VPTSGIDTGGGVNGNEAGENNPSEAQGVSPKNALRPERPAVVAAVVSERHPSGALVWMLLDCPQDGSAWL